MEKELLFDSDGCGAWGFDVEDDKDGEDAERFNGWDILRLMGSKDCKVSSSFGDVTASVDEAVEMSSACR